MSNYIIKHAKLMKPYLKLGWHTWIEYKFNFITNTLTYAVFITLWLVFWKLMIGKLGIIGGWTNPMLTMLIGFSFFNSAVWQITWGTVMFANDVIEGKLDNYMVRPINPLFAMIAERLNLASIIPAMFGLGIILYTVSANYSFEILKILLSLAITLFAVFIIHIFFCLAGLSVFWFGKNNAFKIFLRGFNIVDEYPITIFGLIAVNFFTFVMPKIFIGTYPVLLLTNRTLGWGLKVFATELTIAAFWAVVLVFVWKRGIRRYESHGG